MYHFHYSFIKKNFDTELLFTDRDSLTHEINQKMFMKNFLSGKIYLFDFSNDSKDSKLFNDTNKKVIGKMKDEFVWWSYYN